MAPVNGEPTEPDDEPTVAMQFLKIFLIGSTYYWSKIPHGRYLFWIFAVSQSSFSIRTARLYRSDLVIVTPIMISKQTVLITGCSDGGIGSALALALQQRGLHVFATARDPSKMSDLKGLPDVTMLTLDVAKTDDIKAAVEVVTKQTGGTLDYLVNNAGRNHFMPILDEDLDTVRNLFEVNFYGPLAITQAFSPLLIKAKGMAVYITSISGYVNVPFMG